MSGKRSARQRRVSLHQPAVLQTAESLEVRRLLTAASDEILAEPLVLETAPADDYAAEQPVEDESIQFETELEFIPQVISCEFPEDFWRCVLPVPEGPIEPGIELEYVTGEVPQEISAELTVEPEQVDENTGGFEVSEWFPEVGEERPEDVWLSGDDSSEAGTGEYFVCGVSDGSFTDFSECVPEENFRFDDKMLWSGEVDLLADPEQPEVWGESFAELADSESSGDASGDAFVEDWPVFAEWNEPLILSDDSLLMLSRDLQPSPIMMLRTFALAPAVESSFALNAANVSDVAGPPRSPDSVFSQHAVPSPGSSVHDVDVRLIAVRSETRRAVPGPAVGRRRVPAIATAFQAPQNITEVLSTELSSETSELDVLARPVPRRRPQTEQPVNTEHPPVAPVYEEASVHRTPKTPSDTTATPTPDAIVAELFFQGLSSQP